MMKRLALVLATALILGASWPGSAVAGDATADRCDAASVALQTPAAGSPTRLAQTYTCSGNFGCDKETRYTCRWDYTARACTWQVFAGHCAFMDDPVKPFGVCQ